MDFQVRQEIAQEYEHIKDITQTLANFKKDTVHFGGPRRSQEDEPTRDPDVWPPPTPVERDNRYATILDNYLKVTALITFSFIYKFLVGWLMYLLGKDVEYDATEGFHLNHTNKLWTLQVKPLRFGSTIKGKGSFLELSVKISKNVSGREISWQFGFKLLVS